MQEGFKMPKGFIPNNSPEAREIERHNEAMNEYRKSNRIALIAVLISIVSIVISISSCYLK